VSPMMQSSDSAEGAAERCGAGRAGPSWGCRRAERMRRRGCALRCLASRLTRSSRVSTVVRQAWAYGRCPAMELGPTRT